MRDEGGRRVLGHMVLHRKQVHQGGVGGLAQERAQRPRVDVRLPHGDDRIEENKERGAATHGVERRTGFAGGVVIEGSRARGEVPAGRSPEHSDPIRIHVVLRSSRANEPHRPQHVLQRGGVAVFQEAVLQDEDRHPERVEPPRHRRALRLDRKPDVAAPGADDHRGAHGLRRIGRKDRKRGVIDRVDVALPVVMFLGRVRLESRNTLGPDVDHGRVGRAGEDGEERCKGQDCEGAGEGEWHGEGLYSGRDEFFRISLQGLPISPI